MYAGGPTSDCLYASGSLVRLIKWRSPLAPCSTTSFHRLNTFVSVMPSKEADRVQFNRVSALGAKSVRNYRITALAHVTLSTLPWRSIRTAMASG